MRKKNLKRRRSGRSRCALVVNASERRIGACFFFFEKADYFVGESGQCSGVLLNGRLTTEFFSLPPNVKDFQFRHEHFHLFESNEALPHFGSIYLRQIVWFKGFAYTPQNISYPLG